MADREANRNKLVDAAVELIETLGVAQVTVRALAEHAGVNIAAVNYYFGSKDSLIEAARARTLEHMLSDVDEIVSGLDADPRRATTDLFVYLFEGAVRFPNVTRAHMHEMFVGRPGGSALGDRLAPTIAKIARVVAETTGLPRDRALSRAVQAMSAVLFPSFLQGFFEPAGALKSPKSRRSYVDEIVRALFAPASA